MKILDLSSISDGKSSALYLMSAACRSQMKCLKKYILCCANVLTFYFILSPLSCSWPQAGIRAIRRSPGSVSQEDDVHH